MNLIARLTVTALVAPAALVVLTGTASAETPASQPGVTIGQPIGPVKPVPQGPADLVLPPHVDPPVVGPTLAPAPKPGKPKPLPAGPADLTGDVTDPGPHPAPKPEFPLEDADPVDPKDGPDDEVGPNSKPTGPGLDGPVGLSAGAPGCGTTHGCPTDSADVLADLPRDEPTDEPADSGVGSRGTSVTAGSSLPFTGSSTGLIAALGAALVVAGIGARRIARRES